MVLIVYNIVITSCFVCCVLFRRKDREDRQKKNIEEEEEEDVEKRVIPSVFLVNRHSIHGYSDRMIERVDKIWFEFGIEFRFSLISFALAYCSI